MSRYADKTAVITGGSSGIGLATAARLVQDGARVLITGRDEATLARAAERLGQGVLTQRSDAADLADVTALADRARAELGGVDALFVNAAVPAFSPLAEMTAEAYDRLMAINTRGPYFTVQAFAPLLRPGAGVVLTTSVANVKGLELVSAYGASKAALRSMARTFARELLPQGVRVNALSPGPVDTGILQKEMPADVAAGIEAQMAADNPMQRFGRPEEVAAAMVFLAFDATYTTGAELVVDGGASQL